MTPSVVSFWWAIFTAFGSELLQRFLCVLNHGRTEEA
jgi:hypothetical protein